MHTRRLTAENVQRIHQLYTAAMRLEERAALHLSGRRFSRAHRASEAAYRLRGRAYTILITSMPARELDRLCALQAAARATAEAAKRAA